MGCVSISGGFARVGQFHYLEPVLAECPHHLDEPLELHRLGDEGVHAEVVGAVDVLLGLRGREDDDRDGAQAGVAFDFAQRLAPVHARHVQVEQYQARPRRFALAREPAAVVEVVEQLFAVLDEPQVVGEAALLKRLARHHAVVRVVVGNQDRDRPRAVAHQSLSPVCWLIGKVTTKVEPRPGSLAAVTLPPCRSAMRRTTASPTPVPSYWWRPCRRWKTVKMRSRYFSSNPMPLSSTKRRHRPPPAVPSPPPPDAT